MINRIGYACINTSIKENFKDCRLNTIYTKGIPNLKQIIINNLEVTEKTLLWNLNHNILLYRATSKMIPFATHPDILNDFEFRWYEDKEILTILERIKKVVQSNNIRLSMHPDQFTVLNSPDEKIVRKSIDKLIYHKELLEKMGGSDLIIHTGGVYGDKNAAIKRFIKVFLSLDKNISRYLRLENDDISYTLQDVIDISKSCGIPVILDIHHHNCNHYGSNNINDLIPQVSNSWDRTDLIPKCHISSGISGYDDKRHDNMISPLDFINFREIVNSITVDLMVEAKFKELAVIDLQKMMKI